MPWLEDASFRVGGLDRDGKVTLALAAALAVFFILAAVLSARWPFLVALALSLAAAVVCLAAVVDILATPGLLFTSVGPGLLLACAGALSAVVSSAVGVSARRSASVQ
jgi:hypothetical protein